MPTDVLATVVMHHKSGLVEDQVVNTFAFTTASSPASVADLSAITDKLENFYNTIPPGHNSIANIIAPCIDRNKQVEVKLAALTGHLDGTAHGSPLIVETFDLDVATPGAVGYPSEIAVCLSFHAVFSGIPEFEGTRRPRSSFRGRVYIGPVIRSIGEEESTTLKCRVNQITRETLVTAGTNLLGGTGPVWCVWSRKLQALNSVTAVSVDDAFDIQRRRGEKRTIVTTA